MHYLNATLGIIGALLLFIWCIFLMWFNYYPFQKSMSTTKITSNNDVIIIILKLCIVLQHLLIANEYISMTILLLISIIIFYKCFNEPTYNNSKLETFITIRNLIIMWAYFVLLISKLLKIILRMVLYIYYCFAFL